MKKIFLAEFYTSLESELKKKKSEPPNLKLKSLIDFKEHGYGSAKPLMYNK